jgi:hypothetical protein
MTPRRVRIASWVIAAADAGILAWGALALLAPGQLIPGYEHYTSQSWSALMHTSPATGDYILVLFRLVGALNIAAALPLIVLAFTAFRARQRWAWWTLVTANTIAFGAPITYDFTTGAIGFFEKLEWVALASVLLALAATWPLFTRNPLDGGPRASHPVPPFRRVTPSRSASEYKRESHDQRDTPHSS